MDCLQEQAPELNVYRASEHPKLKKAVFAILDDFLKPPQQHRQKYRQLLWLLVINLWESSYASNNPWRRFDRGSKAYKKVTSRYSKVFISPLLPKVVDQLVDLGFIEQVKGKFNKETLEGHKSRIRATEKLLLLIRTKEIYGVVYSNPDIQQELLKLKDKEKKLMEYEDGEGTNTLRMVLLHANKLLASSDIRVDRKAFTSLKNVSLADKELFRSYSNGSFMEGGRVYGGFWQTIPSELRKTITIDGEPTVELDYKANHPTMLYHITTTVPAPKDCYVVPGYSRDLVKYAMQRILNCKDQKEAISSIAYGVPEENKKRERKGKPLLPKITLIEATKIAEAIEEIHQPIKKSFYKGMGNMCQGLEGEIAMDILNVLTKAGVVCLPVHDSFIVAARHEQVLQELMRDKYYERLNNYPSIDKKY